MALLDRAIFQEERPRTTTPNAQPSAPRAFVCKEFQIEKRPLVRGRPVLRGPVGPVGLQFEPLDCPPFVLLRDYVFQCLGAGLLVPEESTQ